MVTDTKLYNLLYKLTQKAFGLIKGEKFTVYIDRKIKIFNRDDSERLLVTGEKPSKIIDVLDNKDLQDKLEKSEEYLATVDYYIANSKILNSLTRINVDSKLSVSDKVKNLIKIFLYHISWEISSPKFNKDSFDVVYNEYEEFLFSKNFKYVALVPITIRSDDVPLNIDSVSFKRMTNEELEQFMNIHDFFTGPGFNIPFALEFEGEVLHEEIFHIYAIVYSELIYLIKALRIFKEGRIDFDPIHIKVITGGRFNHPVGSMRSHAKGKSLFGECTIIEQEWDKFRVFWKKFNEVSNNLKKFNISLSRFNLALERDNLSDKLIDLMTALESLFGIRMELSFRLSMYVANLIEKGDKRQEIFENVKKAYNMRSNIIHGVRAKTDRELYLVVKNMENYCRKILQRIIKENISREELVEKARSFF